MKKVFAFLLFLIAAFVFAFSAIQTPSAEEAGTNTNTAALNEMIARYVDHTATYTKQTQIFLNDEKSYLVLQIRQTYTMKVKPKSRH